MVALLLFKSVLPIIILSVEAVPKFNVPSGLIVTLPAASLEFFCLMVSMNNVPLPLISPPTVNSFVGVDVPIPIFPCWSILTLSVGFAESAFVKNANPCPSCSNNLGY